MSVASDCDLEVIIHVFKTLNPRDESVRVRQQLTRGKSQIRLETRFEGLQSLTVRVVSSDSKWIYDEVCKAPAWSED